MSSQRGFTLPELMIGMGIMGVACVAFSSMLRYVMKTTTTVRVQGEAMEDSRQALMRLEEGLMHASEVRVASSTFVEFVVDIDQSPLYDRNGDLDGDGIPNYSDADRDGDSALLQPATVQWRAGFNLKDDDEDGDGQIDVVRRLYLLGKDLWEDTSLNEGAWGGAYGKRIATNVSTFTLTYFGNKANDLGRNIDLGNDGGTGTGDAGENDGIITATEIDMVPAPAGMGDRSGALDLVNERRYITTIRLYFGMDRNLDGNNDFTVETDVYPTLLPLKSR